MKRNLLYFIITLFVLILSFTACATYDTFPDNLSQDIDDPATLKALIDEGKTTGEGEYRIVDVRPENAYKKAHIPTAINIPNGDTTSMENPPEKSKYIIVYCETGGRAQAAAKTMADNGYEYIYNWGGFGGWPYDAESSE